jgi:hypothetical protein
MVEDKWGNIYPTELAAKGNPLRGWRLKPLASGAFCSVSIDLYAEFISPDVGNRQLDTPARSSGLPGPE